jgi:oligo-1,6-glucosidase
MEEIKAVMRFWLDKGAAGFRCDVINLLYKESLEDGKRGLFSHPVRGLEHYKTTEGTHAILRELRRDVLDKPPDDGVPSDGAPLDAAAPAPAPKRSRHRKWQRPFTVGECVMVTLPEAQALSGKDRGELDMVFYFDHLEVDRVVSKMIPKKFRAAKLLEVLTKWQQGLEWNALYLENHDQPRIVSHYGAGALGTGPRDAENWMLSAKMLGMLELTLRGTPFIYQGQEIGMTNFDYQSINDLNDVESRNMDALMKRLCIPKWLRWRWIKAASRDNARTPMQWDAGTNAGFTTGTPWLPVNSNHTRITYNGQKHFPGSILCFYKRFLAFRAASDCLKYGDFTPVYADNAVMAYQRALKDEAYLVLLNFSGKVRKLSPKIPVPAEPQIAFSNTGRNLIGGILLPWEGLLIILNK